MTTKTYWVTDAKEVIVAVEDDGTSSWNYLPISGDPSSLGDHVSPAIREASANPLPKDEWEKYLSSLPTPAPSAPPTTVEKLASMGLTVEGLKELLTS